MDKTLRSVLLHMLNKRKIGGSHTPEDAVIQPKIKFLTREERHEFEKEYKEAINNGWILPKMKRTGKVQAGISA